MKTKLQVIFVSPHSDPQAILGEPDAGGQCLYENQLATALTELAPVQVTVFCRQTELRPEISQVNKDYQIQRISCGPEGFIPKEEIDSILPEFSRKLLAELGNLPTGPRVFNGHYWDGAKAVLYLKKKTPDLHFIWTPHSLAVPKRHIFKEAINEHLFNFIPRLIWENYALLAADKVIATSQFIKDTLDQDYLVNNNVTVITPAIDLEKYFPHSQTQVRRELNIPQDKFVLLCLGRMSYFKGYQYAIHALKYLEKEMPGKVFLVICSGSVNAKGTEEIAYAKELRRQIKDSGLEEFISLRPAVEHENIHKVYAAADLFLMTTENEPFGLTVLEAMAAKLPVVANNKGGPTHIIKHNQTGSLVDIHNSERVAGYIEAFIKDPIFRERIIKNAFTYVNSEYKWGEKAREILEVYNAALAQPQQNNIFNKLLKKNYFLNQTLKL